MSVFNKNNLMFILIVTGLFLLFTACEESIGGEDFVSPEDSSAAVQKVDEAQAALEDVIEGMIDSDPDSLEEALTLLDFSEPYTLYLEAQSLNPGNSDANFGVALTGFMMISQDEDLKELLLRWEAYFKANDPFKVSDELSPNLLGSNGFGLPLTIDGIKIPVAPFISTPMRMAKMTVDEVPQFSELQALIESLFLPTVQASIDALEAIEEDEDFVFYVTGAMQGDPEADIIEIDLTEVYALDMMLYSLKAALNAMNAYNFDFVSFDATGIVSELSQDSDFGTLKTTGATSLSTALASMQTATEKALSALDFLENESDNQNDDLIPQPDGDDDLDLNEVREGIQDVQNALSEPTMIYYGYYEDIYDDDGYWIDDVWVEDSVRVDVSQFFTNPIQDFKDMLPAYTVSTALDTSYDWDSFDVPFYYYEESVTVDGLSNSNISINMYYSRGDWGENISATAWVGNYFMQMDGVDPNAVPDALWEAYQEFLSQIDAYSTAEYSYVHVSLNWDGNATTGEPLEINSEFWIEVDYFDGIYVYPVLTWNANTYDEWLNDPVNGWPDPTFNGIFPDFDAAALAEFLDFDPDYWEKNTL